MAAIYECTLCGYVGTNPTVKDKCPSCNQNSYVYRSSLRGKC